MAAEVRSTNTNRAARASSRSTHGVHHPARMPSSRFSLRAPAAARRRGQLNEKNNNKKKAESDALRCGYEGGARRLSLWRHR